MTPPAARRPGRATHDLVTRVLSLAMVVIGVALLLRGSLVGLLLGVLFAAAGIGRLYVQARLRARR